MPYRWKVYTKYRTTPFTSHFFVAKEDAQCNLISWLISQFHERVPPNIQNWEIEEVANADSVS